jgi:hypothetical protein
METFLFRRLIPLSLGGLLFSRARFCFTGRGHFLSRRLICQARFGGFSSAGTNAALAACRLPWRCWRAASSLRSRAAKISGSRPAILSAGVT